MGSRWEYAFNLTKALAARRLYLNAVIGSAFAARRAGTRLATSVTASNSIAVAMSVVGFLWAHAEDKTSHRSHHAGEGDRAEEPQADAERDDCE